MQQEHRLTFFGRKNPSASPGTEDCLKLWVWAPASATPKSKLPVMVYTHGGGMQNSQVRQA
jgi:carboxylesterase type B